MHGKDSNSDDHPAPAADHDGTLHRLCTLRRICPVQVLANVNGKAELVHPERCTYCALCEDLCPEDAIALPFLIVFADVQR